MPYLFFFYLSLTQKYSLTRTIHVRTVWVGSTHGSEVYSRTIWPNIIKPAKLSVRHTTWGKQSSVSQWKNGFLNENMAFSSSEGNAFAVTVFENFDTWKCEASWPSNRRLFPSLSLHLSKNISHLLETGKEDLVAKCQILRIRCVGTTI